MTVNNVFELHPYAVAIDVCVELHLVSMEITLCFGPFNTHEAANKWCSAFEKEHKQIEGREVAEDAQAEKKTGVPTQPFLRTYVYGAGSFQAEGKARAKGELIPPKTPAVDAHQIHVYALCALQEAITAAQRFLDDTKDSA